MRAICPRCGDKSRTLTISRVSGTNLAFVCHRNSCGVRGYTESRYDGDHTTAKKETPEVQSCALPNDVREWLLSRYELEDSTLDEEGVVWWPTGGRVLLPLYDKQCRRYGYVGRAVHAEFRGPKALTIVQDTAWPGGGFTRTCRDSCIAVIVEDLFSAYAVAEFGYRGIALAGTNCTDTLEALLQDFQEIFVALDADATGKGAELTQQLAYLGARQMVVDKDIKDMNVHERSALLGYA